MLERQRKIWYSSSAQSKQLETLYLFQRGTEELDSMKFWSDRQRDLQGTKSVGNAVQNLDLSEDSSDARLRPSASFMHNTTSAIDMRDPLCSEKLQFSGFTSPPMNGVNSLSFDKPSQGIPLYYFKYDSKREAGSSPASDSSLPLSSLGFGSSSIPWMDTGNKSFSLGSYVPPSKLVSGSISIGNNSPQLHRVVHEVEDMETDQAAYVNKFQDLGVSGPMKGSSAVAKDISAAVEVAGLPSFARVPTTQDAGWRPRGVLVAHLQEHRSAVNDIAISTDHSFFVSASDDSTVNVWDSRKLEKDISFRSRLTYSLEGSRALCTAMLHGSAQVIVGTSDGMIHMFSVDHISRGLGNVVEKYSGIADVKKNCVGEGAITSLVNYSADDSALI
ncbi:hypothetical protein AgCh_017268 [Apium graveolens]